MHAELPQNSAISAPRTARLVFTPRTWRRILLYSTLIVIAILFVAPVLWMVSTAFKPTAEWYMVNLIPYQPTLVNFQKLLNAPDAPISRWFLNSVFVATASSVLALLVGVPAAYAYARLDFVGRNVLFAIMIGTLLIPGLLFLVPDFLIVNQLGLLNSYGAVIIPGLGNAFGVFFLRQFFLGLPVEIEEAMLIDGANRWRIMWSMVVPLSKGALATLFVLSFLSSWNDYLWPLVVLTTPTILTLPVGVANFQSEYAAFPGLVMAGAMIAVLPVLIIFTVLQRFIVQSVASAAIKG